MTAVLDRVNEHLPPGVRVEMRLFRRRFVLFRVVGDEQLLDGGWVAGADGSGRPSLRSGGDFIGGLGTWIPFVPHALGIRLTAQDAVESALEVAYADSDHANRGDIDFNVCVELAGDEVRVRFCDPSGDEIELRALPVSLF
jgi:hypothetical protein